MFRLIVIDSIFSNSSSLRPSRVCGVAYLLPPSGLFNSTLTHGLRRGLHISCAASRFGRWVYFSFSSETRLRRRLLGGVACLVSRVLYFDQLQGKLLAALIQPERRLGLRMGALVPDIRN